MYNCPRCGRQLRFVDEQQQYWCDTCQIYNPQPNQIQQPPRSKKGYSVGQIIGIVVVLGIVGLIILGSLASTSDNILDNIPDNTPDNTPDNSYNIGEAVTLNDYTVLIVSTEEAEYFTWYSDIGGIQTEFPDPGNKYLLVDVEVTYLGDSTDYSYAGDFWTLDSNNVKMDYSSDMIYHDDGFDPMTLNQNQKHIGIIVFELPDDMTQFKLQYDFGDIFETEIGTWDVTL